MTYIENIYICIVVPILLSLLFIRSSQRKFTLFILIGMTICLITAYVNSFLMGYYQTDTITAAIEITPVCEEIMKFLPLIVYILIFEPEDSEILAVAIAIATGFATFENVCYLTINGAENLVFLIIRGLSAGALHILCGVAIGQGLAFAINRKWLMLAGTVGTLGVCITFHATYNLMISSDVTLCNSIGYIFPCLLILLFFVYRKTVAEKKRVKEIQ